MTHHDDPFARTYNTACEWLATVAQALGTRDRRFTYRVLRAWLHVLRDRLTVEAAAHFAAQLPELLRGTFYDGWVPSKQPQRFSVEECITRVSTEATVRRADVRQVIGGVTTGMRELLSTGALDHALDQLPKDLRELFTGAQLPATPLPAEPGLADQLRGVRDDVELLADAVATLARGLAENSASPPLGERGAEAARTVKRIMLARQS
ncbi:DUF2267 domain-containing protein [Saccharomonospora sp. NPDC046836]|uniref:DUF2267 domain-containing protein n=1 Tax=Saccharomonospora sp. NPDC046836 TaxID=3156921 RepID=UPI0033F16321